MGTNLMPYSSLKMSLALIVNGTLRSFSCFQKRGCNDRVLTVLLIYFTRKKIKIPELLLKFGYHMFNMMAVSS
jgi:hypothetical protein